MQCPPSVGNPPTKALAHLDTERAHGSLEHTIETRILVEENISVSWSCDREAAAIWYTGVARIPPKGLGNGTPKCAPSKHGTP